MKISVPEVPTYYYEISGKNRRLLYWLPRKVLTNMVEQGKADKSILVDFPDGVDIKVGEDEFADFQRTYDLTLGIDPKAITDAFTALCLKEKGKYRGVGYIGKEVLDSIAGDVDRELKKRKLHEKIAVIAVDDTVKKKKLFIKQMRQVQEKITVLKEYLPRKLTRNRPIFEQLAHKIEMTKGDAPFKVFSAIQIQKPKEADDAG
jgi:hypothetical protein